MSHRALQRPGRWTLGIALAALLALLLAAPAPAPAAGAAQLQERAPSAQVKASGTGKITVVGRFSIIGKIPAGSASRLVVVDRAGGAQAFLGGKPLRFNALGRINRRGASGILLVVGENVTVTIGGAGLVFSLAGVGRARFAGTGRYQLNLGPNRAWSRSWVRIAQPAPVAATPALRIAR